MKPPKLQRPEPVASILTRMDRRLQILEYRVKHNRKLIEYLIRNPANHGNLQNAIAQIQQATKLTSDETAKIKAALASQNKGT